MPTSATPEKNSERTAPRAQRLRGRTRERDSVAKPNTKPTKRSVIKSKPIPCQGWDKGTGKCGAESPYSITYRVKGVDVAHTWHFCKRHYGKQMRKKYGTCSYRERRADGTLDNCTSLRVTNTKPRVRRRPGYCRRHENQYLINARYGAVNEALDRLARIVTVKADTGCWETPAPKGGGRSKISCGGMKWTTYRLSYTAFHGSHETGRELSHDCDNSLCCNPMHVTPLRPRQNRDAEHDGALAVFWAVTATIKRPPPELQAWADSHGLPLYGTETTRIAESFFPSEEELNAQYWADLEAGEQEDTALSA